MLDAKYLDILLWNQIVGCIIMEDGMDSDYDVKLAFFYVRNALGRYFMWVNDKIMEKFGGIYQFEKVTIWKSHNAPLQSTIWELWVANSILDVWLLVNSRILIILALVLSFDVYEFMNCNSCCSISFKYSRLPISKLKVQLLNSMNSNFYVWGNRVCK